MSLVQMYIHPQVHRSETFSEIILVEETMALPIYVTHWQADSILHGLQGQVTGRPMTHDVFIKVINGMSGSVNKVVIDGLHSGVFMAKLYIEYFQGNTPQELILDARPSDCVALAAREGCNIYVSEDVLAEAGKTKEELGIEDH
jgi:bifunctional DNase/RNase